MQQSQIIVIKNITGRGVSHLRVVLEIDGTFQANIKQPVETYKSLNYIQSIYAHFLIFIFIFFLPFFVVSQTTYTFHTAGNWTDAANWSPSYPGLTISDASININALCNLNVDNIYLPNCNVNISSNGSMFFNSSFCADPPPRIQNFGIININNSFITCLGDLFNYGTIEISTQSRIGNFMTLDTLINHGVINNNRVFSVTNSSYLENNGTINLNSTSSFTSTLRIREFGEFLSTGTINGWGIVSTLQMPNTTLILISSGSINPTPQNIIFNNFGANIVNLPVFNCNINGVIQGSSYDHISASSVNLGASSINVTWGFAPSIGQTFDILTHDSRIGQFASVNIPPIAGLSFVVDYTDPNKTSIVVSQALPITLNYFNVLKKNNDINLHWQTRSEINNHYFDIEYSTDGTDFSTIGRKDGAGNSNSLLDYNFVHKNVDAGVHYYRLKQMDYDGQYSYSDIVSIFVKREGNDVSIYPNPTQNIINIIGADGLYYALYDLVGRKVSDGQISDDVISIDHLLTGMYYLHLDSDERKSVFKIWKE